MLPDWFTVTAQAINFLVLVALLKRFLYKPILEAIGQRETRIASQVREAEAKQAEANTARDTYRRKNEELEHQRSGLLREATDEAKSEREALLAAARQEAADLKAKLALDLEAERDNVQREATACVRREVLGIARQALKEMADLTLEERIAMVFLQRLRTLPEEQRSALQGFARTSHRPLLVRSAFALSSAVRETLLKGIQDALQVDLPVQFEITQSMIAGIELATDGHKVAWSVAEYLAELQSTLDRALDHHQLSTLQQGQPPLSHAA